MDNKVWLITGISSGIGHALATEVMAKGDFVIGTFRKEAQVEAFNTANAGKGHAILLDVTDFTSMEKHIAMLSQQYGRIDVLVNNAGYGLAGAIEETSIAETRALFEANFFGALKLTQEVLPLMRQQKQGHIVQISSHGGFKAFPGFGMYNASKFALEGFSEALAAEVAPLGIKVSIVEPGPFRTKFAGSGFVLAEKAIEDYNGTAGLFRQKIKGVDGIQEGDPAKAASAIYYTVQQEKAPLRLPLGKIALGTLNAKLESVKNDIEASRALAEGAVFL